MRERQHVADLAGDQFLPTTATGNVSSLTVREDKVTTQLTPRKKAISQRRWNIVWRHTVADSNVTHETKIQVS